MGTGGAGLRVRRGAVLSAISPRGSRSGGNSAVSLRGFETSAGNEACAAYKCQGHENTGFYRKEEGSQNS